MHILIIVEWDWRTSNNKKVRSLSKLSDQL